MASLNLSQEELKAVEQTRQRLSQLSNSILSLKNDVFASNPFPNLDSLQASADILQLNLRNCLEVVAQHDDLFGRVAVHPSTNFPGRTQENILLQLLRKKAEPDVEAAMDEGRKALAALIVPPTDNHQGVAATAIATSRMTTSIQEQQEKERELDDMWTEAREACDRRIYEYAMNEESDPFTLEERATGVHHVRTGLRRTFEAEESSDNESEYEDEEGGNGGGAAARAGIAAANEGDDDVMVVDRPPPPPAPAVVTQEVEGLPLDNVMRLATRGQFHG
ncbi:mediator of RNA polymerase II transcription complex subunit 8-domain-containing protein [Biscogniauxia marginata]|nr:mediator of RNA polymerase II transcription complex subunit 8-domain-containing protein [Biscogniauxia marginata]